VGPVVDSADPPERAAAGPGGGSSFPSIEFRGITKSYPGQLAVDDVSFSVMPGEIHGLVGENGAGKSTLIKVLTGNVSADAGSILVRGQIATIRFPDEATGLGIGVIHQEPALFPTLSIAENLAIGTRYALTAFRTIDWRRQSDAVRPVLDAVSLHVDPRERVAELSAHQRQLVAFARLLLQDCRVVVLDEVTAPLTQAEVERLSTLLRNLRDRGVAIIYVTHRLHEIFDLADRVTVMRNGRWVATRSLGDVDPDELTRLIIGSDPATRFRRADDRSDAQTVLEVRGLTDDVLDDVSFDLREGEVLGIAGLAGSGRSNIVETLFGLRRAHAGALHLRGRRIHVADPADAVREGIALVTEDRKVDGFIPTFTVGQNLSLPWLRSLRRFGLIDLRREAREGREVMARFDIRARSVESRMTELSGGNQQKAILGRWLSRPLAVLLLDEPTHGVDVGAKARIYEIIRGLAAQGVSTVIISSELEELEGLCSRVLLLAEGRLVGELRGEEIEKGRMLTDLYRAMSRIADAA
jgi:ABC-type sugar transport system ATPase subunit